MNTGKLFNETDKVYFVHVVHIEGDVEKNYIYMVIASKTNSSELHIYSYDPNRRVIRFLGMRFS